MRVHELAKKIGKSSKEVLAVCKKLSVEAKSHMSILPDETLDRICSACGVSTPDARALGIVPAAKPAVKPAEKQKQPVKKAPAKSFTGKKEPKKDFPRGAKKPLREKDQSKKGRKEIAVSEAVKKRIEQKLSSAGPASQSFTATPKKRITTTQQMKPRVRSGQQPTAAGAPQPAAAAQKRGRGDLERKYRDEEDGAKQAPLLAAKRNAISEVPGKDNIEIRLPITVGGLATNMELKTSVVIKALMEEGIFANVNQLLNEEIVRKITTRFNVTLNILPTEEEELILTHEVEEVDEKLLKGRAPVVTFMGHVDHGKTSLLDAIRNSRLVDREAGKITQHIGAYAVDIPGKGAVTFLDTPGHEAFTAMRARGANVTDIVVLVVAADDGVMPQTVEAINHARAAGVPIIVAINKSDLPSANPDRVKAEMQKYELVPEEWGGKTIFVSVSALKRTGIDELLEMLLLEAEVLELKAIEDRPAQGVVLEARVTKNHGVVTHVLITNGSLKIGDYLICGKFFGRVRALHNDRGRNITNAGPSMPVEIFGIQGVPNAADKFYVVEDEKTARRISEQKILEDREKELSAKFSHHISLESLYDKMASGEQIELNVIVKADVQGSVEVLQHSLEKLSQEKIKLKIIHTGVGGINESDIMLAAASDAIIIGFHVKANMRAQTLAEQEGIDIRYYKVIYDAIQDVKTAMEGRLAPTYKEVVMGSAQVREIFKASKIGTIAGCYVLKGKIARSHKVRALRDDIVVYEGSFSSLKRFKDDMREVREGFECGLTLNNYNDIKSGDIIETYVEEAVATKLDG